MWGAGDWADSAADAISIMVGLSGNVKRWFLRMMSSMLASVFS